MLAIAMVDVAKLWQVLASCTKHKLKLVVGKQKETSND